jgi:predicted ATP-binding protein involved in virulence
MIIHKLQLTGLKSFEHAEFNFKPGMNLLVGINGVGKTTTLDALRVCLSSLLPNITSSRSQKIRFDTSDIRVGYDAIDVVCDFQLHKRNFTLLLHKQRYKNVENEPGNVRAQTIYTPDLEEFSPALSGLSPTGKDSTRQPLGIFFSTRRSLIVDQKASPHSAAGGQAAAYSESLSPNREFNLRIIAQWFKVQEELGEENPVAIRHIRALKKAVSLFLPDFKNLRVMEVDGNLNLVIEKKKIPLPVSQLSDGERGVLSMVLDLARRLSQANPALPNPVRDGIAVVLIDELDLHLHPIWQRSIVEKLTMTFRNCQFIATTHSPQIIPSVEPERIQLLENNEVITPDKSLGMDSNWILRHLMETGDRPEASEAAIQQVEKLMNKGNFKAARTAMAKYTDSGLDLSEWAIFEARMARLESFDEDDD